MTIENVLDKVRKLLRLSTSSNANEAALAAAKAQELIDRHNLSAAMLALENAEPVRGMDDEPIRDWRESALDSGKVLDRWRGYLASTIAGANACKAYGSGGDLFLVGRASDVETVRYMYGWIVREVERLTTAVGNGMGRTWRNNFRLGVVDTVARKIREQREKFEHDVRTEAKQADEGAANPQALMRVNQGLSRVFERKLEVAKWVKANMHLRSTSGSSRSDAGARQAGRKAGESINIGGARRGLTSAAKGIGSGAR